jgi:hypothetical protein
MQVKIPRRLTSHPAWRLERTANEMRARGFARPYQRAGTRNGQVRDLTWYPTCHRVKCLLPFFPAKLTTRLASVSCISSYGDLRRELITQFSLLESLPLSARNNHDRIRRTQRETTHLPQAR